MSPDTARPAPSMPSFAPRLYGIALLVAAIVLGGIALMVRWQESDKARDVQSWHEKLGLIAQSREAEMESFVEDRFKELRTLASNPSLELYLSELQTPSQGTETPQEPAEKTYLRNLLLFTAQRTGFDAGNATPVIKADVAPVKKGGLAIIDNAGRIMVATTMPQVTRDLILQRANAAPQGKEMLIDLAKDKEAVPYIGFIVPVFSIQGDHNPASAIGKIVGILPVGSNLFNLLKHPGTTEKTLEALLVRQDGNEVEYLSPLKDGTAALSMRLPSDPAHLATAYLIRHAGDFTDSLKDYHGKSVLATSRAIAGTPWVLIEKIDEGEALAAGMQRRNEITALCLLGIACIALGFITVWWRAHSVRAMLLSTHFRNLAATAQAQEQLLKVVADNQPEPISIVDEHQTYHFANQKAADKAHMSPDSVIGKPVSDVRGGAYAEQLIEPSQKALALKTVVYDVRQTQEGGQEKTIRAAYVPLERIPIVSLPDPTPGVLIVEQDISEAIREREQRLTTQRQLVETLVRLVDRRDPFAANHSLLVSHIAHEVAVDMELDDTTIETAQIAGSLMNIGKIIISSKVLTKAGSLTEEEKRIVRDSMHASAELLKDVHFAGPVADTLRQWQEQWDGSGPLGLKGNAILISARIIASANAFVGMISPRSWRDAMTIEAATAVLLEQSDTHFDRRVVIALIHYVENHRGRVWLQRIMENQQAV